MLQTPNLRLDRLEPGIAVMTLDVAGRPVNVLHRQVLDEIETALGLIENETSLRQLLVVSGKASGFAAGADVRELADIDSAAAASALSARGQQVFARLEGLSAVSAAVIHGPCLGGGLELALACDYRLVVEEARTRLGLPEVELGLLPAWGGTQRLPRVIGVAESLRCILGGKRLAAAEAVRLRLADQLLRVPREQAIAEASRFMQGKAKRPKATLPRYTWRQTLIEGNPVGRGLLFRQAARTLRRRVPDDMPAPAEALTAVRVGVTQGMAAGLAQEQSAAGRLATSAACRSLVGLFLRREAARTLPAELREQARPIRTVGVVGAGIMGAGIAQLAALHGCQVIIQEASTEALGAASLRIANLFRQAVERGVLTTVEMVRGLGAIRGSIDWRGFDAADLVVEAVTESLDIKRTVLAALEEHVPAHAILASNTSALRIADLQEGRRRPEQIAGLHFFQPVHKMPLVEVARGPRSSEATLATLMQWAIDLGKTPVLVQDSPGFVVNRVLMPYLFEARLLVQEGNDRRGVDRLMRRFGMPMGPLEMIDMVGPKLVEQIATELQPFFGDRLQAEPSRRKCDPAEMLSRLVLPMVNEAADCLGAGLVASADQLDLAMVLGSGWAPHRGGPMRYGESRGLAEVVKMLDELAGTHGRRFAPCAELRRRAESQAFACPCCGYLTLGEEPPGTYLICPVCNWEDDSVQFHNPSYEGGANAISLIEARRNFREFGARSKEDLAHVRPPEPNEIPPCQPSEANQHDDRK